MRLTLRCAFVLAPWAGGVARPIRRRAFRPRLFGALAAALVVTVGLVACQDPEDGICTGARLHGPPQVLFGGDRPVEILVPPDYDPTCPTPLLLVLHGYSASGALQALYFDVERFVSEHRVLVAVPDGTFDARGNRFWMAGKDYCCPYWNDAVDDVAYLASLIDDIAAVHNVDLRRVYVLGHSNGGMMAYRLACDMGDRLAAVAVLAGISPPDLGGCVGAATSVLHIHGTADDTVRYAGGDNLLGDGGPAYPGAAESTLFWARHNGCEDATALGPPLDLESGSVVDETSTADFAGCPTGGQVTLWTIQNGSHLPPITARGLPHIWTWLAPKRLVPAGHGP